MKAKTYTGGRKEFVDDGKPLGDTQPTREFKEKYNEWVGRRKEKFRLSWFQKVILFYFVFLGFLSGLIQEGFAYALGSALGLGFVIYLIMWLSNKFIAKKIKVKNKTLIKTWGVVRIIITCLIALWFIFAFIGYMGY